MTPRTQIPLSDTELLVRAVRTCINTDRPLWAVVAERFAVGSGIARQLCRRFDLDPDEIRRSEQTPLDEDE